MPIDRHNFAIYIVTYNRPKILNESIRQYLESLPFIPPITVISNHSNCTIDADLKKHVNLIFNNLRPDESWGYLTRNWNQCFQLGLVKHEWLLCSQDDVIIKPGWLDLDRASSRDLKWLGSDDDDDSFLVRITGFQIDR